MRMRACFKRGLGCLLTKMINYHIGKMSNYEGFSTLLAPCTPHVAVASLCSPCARRATSLQLLALVPSDLAVFVTGSVLSGRYFIHTMNA